MSSDQEIIKNGKKPVSKASKTTPVNYKDLFTNKLSIPPDVKADCEARGLVTCWLNATKIATNGGYTEDGWELYRRPQGQSATITGSELRFGQDPSGYLRRGDAILGVRSKEIDAAYKAYMQEKNDRQLQRVSQIPQEFKQELKQALPDARVHEGFEENES